MRDGTVDKLMSDQVIAFFGTPYNEREHELRAVEAAVDVIDALEDRWTGAPLVAAAIGTGEAFVGNVGEGATRDYTAVGRTVNATHELLGYARPGEVLLLPATYDAVSSRYPDAPVRTIADQEDPSLWHSARVASILFEPPQRSRRRPRCSCITDARRTCARTPAASPFPVGSSAVEDRQPSEHHEQRETDRFGQ